VQRGGWKNDHTFDSLYLLLRQQGDEWAVGLSRGGEGGATSSIKAMLGRALTALSVRKDLGSFESLERAGNQPQAYRWTPPPEGAFSKSTHYRQLMSPRLTSAVAGAARSEAAEAASAAGAAADSATRAAAALAARHLLCLAASLGAAPPLAAAALQAHAGAAVTLSVHAELVPELSPRTLQRVRLQRALAASLDDDVRAATIMDGILLHYMGMNPNEDGAKVPLPCGDVNGRLPPGTPRRSNGLPAIAVLFLRSLPGLAAAVEDADLGDIFRCAERAPDNVKLHTVVNIQGQGRLEVLLKGQGDRMLEYLKLQGRAKRLAELRSATLAAVAHAAQAAGVTGTLAVAMDSLLSLQVAGRGGKRCRAGEPSVHTAPAQIPHGEDELGRIVALAAGRGAPQTLLSKLPLVYVADGLCKRLSEAEADAEQGQPGFVWLAQRLDLAQQGGNLEAMLDMLASTAQQYYYPPAEIQASMQPAAAGLTDAGCLLLTFGPVLHCADGAPMPDTADVRKVKYLTAYSLDGGAAYSGDTQITGLMASEVWRSGICRGQYISFWSEQGHNLSLIADLSATDIGAGKRTRVDGKRLAASTMKG